MSDLDAEKVTGLASTLKRQFPGLSVECALHAEEQQQKASQADVVVQATPVGMKLSDPPLLPSACFSRGQCVFDLVYMYPETATLKAAKTAGARVSNGLGMLLHQGAKAFEIWTGRAAEVGAMKSALEGAVYKR